MRIVVRTPELRWPIRVPIPLSMAGMAMSFIPERTLAQAREKSPPELRELLTKPMLRYLVGECVHTLKEYRGLEIVHVESAGGETVSITL